jgi:peptidoglycan/LPS O-acetylase OafA/YrhL
MTDPTRPDHVAPPSEAQPSRRRELDALRAFVVIGLVFFHSARVFDSGDFYVKNDPTSEVVDALIAFAVMWGMPLLFVIAGIGIWHSLQKRTVGMFVAERTKRLLVPLVFGVLVIVPPQVWYQVRIETGRWPGYLAFYRDFLDVELNLQGFPLLVRAVPTTGYFEYGQLWFLVLLFAWSLLLIPFFVVVNRRRLIRRAVDRYGAWSIASWSLAIVTSISVALPLKEETALWSSWSYLVFVAFGFVFASDRRIARALRAARRWVLAAAVVGFAGFSTVHIVRSDVAGVDLLTDYDFMSIVFRASFAIGGWCWVASILSFTAPRRSSRRRGERRDGPTRILWRRFAAVANEAVLPVYVLHQTVIVVLAFLIISWPLAFGLKYLVLATSALVFTLLLVQVVRRTHLTRYLFGMKAGPEPAATAHQ